MVSKTRSECHKRFVEAGFFPIGLPPPFVSKDLATHRVTIEKVWRSYQNTRQETNGISDISPRRRSLYFQKRKGLVGSLPSLIQSPFFYLSREISRHWVDIKKHVKKSNCSVLSRYLIGMEKGLSFDPISKLRIRECES